MSFNVIVGGVVRHITYTTRPGQVATNKRDYQCIGISGGSTVGSAAILSYFETNMNSLIKALMSIEAGYYGGQLYYQTPTPPAPRPESSTAFQGVGDVAGGVLPQQTSGLISLYSDDLGKAGQGRIYIPFPSTDDHGSDGTPIPSYVTRLNDLGDFLIQNHNITDGAATGVFVPVLYVPGGAPPKRITKYISRDAWATQRRRGNFGRVNANPF